MLRVTIGFGTWRIGAAPDRRDACEKLLPVVRVEIEPQVFSPCDEGT
jgi:hypothetical protein